MSFDVFISYANKDKLAADAACAALEAEQVRCWIAPRDILPGADWGASIIEALDQCRLMVLIFSANANDSPQIRNEVVHAVQRGVPVIPVRIEDIAPAKSLAYFMGAVHWLDALSPPLENHLKRLAETVRAMLRISAAPGAAQATGAPQAVAVSEAPVVLPAAGTQGRASARPAAKRTGLAAIGAVAVAVLIAAWAAFYFQPVWQGWLQTKSNSPPASPQPPVLAGAPPLSDLLLARFALMVPVFSVQDRERRVRDYVESKQHRAQAVSLQPPGTWRSGGRTSPQVAEEAALENCQVNQGTPCVLIAVNDTVLPVPADGNWPRRDMVRVRYAGNFDPNQIPGRGNFGERADVSGYAAASGPKAVAYHPSSRLWVYVGGGSQRTAEEKVLEACNNDPGRSPLDVLCFLYATGNQVVLPQRLRKPAS